MTEITVRLSSSEAQVILDGLLQVGYDSGHCAEVEEQKASQFQLDDKGIGAGMAMARAMRARDRASAAYSAYGKLVKLFLDERVIT